METLMPLDPNRNDGLGTGNIHGYRDGTPESHRSRNLKKLYGVTLDEWNTLFKKQGSCCLICGSSEPRGKNWHTDHCHCCGNVRGILCGWCNTGIGKLQEDTEVLIKAFEYITRHRLKGQGKADIEKAIHYLELLLELEYN